MPPPAPALTPRRWGSGGRRPELQLGSRGESLKLPRPSPGGSGAPSPSPPRGAIGTFLLLHRGAEAEAGQEQHQDSGSPSPQTPAGCCPGPAAPVPHPGLGNNPRGSARLFPRPSGGAQLLSPGPHPAALPTMPSCCPGTGRRRRRWGQGAPGSPAAPSPRAWRRKRPGSGWEPAAGPGSPPPAVAARPGLRELPAQAGGSSAISPSSRLLRSQHNLPRTQRASRAQGLPLGNPPAQERAGTGAGKSRGRRRPWWRLALLGSR